MRVPSIPEPPKGNYSDRFKKAPETLNANSTKDFPSLTPQAQNEVVVPKILPISFADKVRHIPDNRPIYRAEYVKKEYELRTAAYSIPVLKTAMVVDISGEEEWRPHTPEFGENEYLGDDGEWHS
jgi:hypothetical protein